jgi:hypothetical protein
VAAPAVGEDELASRLLDPADMRVVRARREDDPQGAFLRILEWCIYLHGAKRMNIGLVTSEIPYSVTR